MISAKRSGPPRPTAPDDLPSGTSIPTIVVSYDGSWEADQASQAQSLRARGRARSRTSHVGAEKSLGPPTLFGQLPQIYRPRTTHVSDRSPHPVAAATVVTGPIGGSR
jgi:hypothetical protein